MSLDLPQLIPQVNALGNSIAQRLAKIDQTLPHLLQQLEEASQTDPDLLHQKWMRAGENWPGAIPTAEPIHASFPPPDLPKVFNVVAADGSQIHPDRHAAARFYLINIGSIRIRYGSGDVPQTAITSSLYYEDEHFYDEEGTEIGAAWINGLRDVSELEALAQVSKNCSGEPTISLLDNGLLLWLAAQSGPQPNRQVMRLLQRYLQQLSDLQKTGAAIAGFIDRPRHSNLIALLHLESLELDEITEDALRVHPYLGFSDRSLFARVLEPGYRSALFIQNSKLNRDFRKNGQEVHFFYLHPGEQSQVARVEVPHWVAHSPKLLNLVHAAIIEQCKLTGGYPYALVRSHELAVVNAADRQVIDTMIQRTLLQHRWIPQHSLKSETKRWTSKRRRHRL
jgi:hypothetical protein